MARKKFTELLDRLFCDVWNEKKIEVIDEIFAESCVVHYPDQTLMGREALKKAVSNWQVAFPDMIHRVEETLHDGSKLVARWTGKGTHLGVFQGALPTRKTVSYSGISILTARDGLFTECWVSPDMDGIRNRLREVSDKVYTRDDFNADFRGPARDINEVIFRARSTPSCNQIMVNALRREMSKMPPDDAPQIAMPDELFEQVESSEIRIPGKDAEVRALVYRPKVDKELASRLPKVVWFHGGGWSTGSPDETDLVTRKLALTSRVIVVSVDYRLAPEFPYPHGFNDCFQAYTWALDNERNGLNTSSGFVAVGGDSCGGNFAAAVTLRARDEKAPLPGAAILLWPLTDFIVEKYPSYNGIAPRGLLYDAAFIGYARSSYAPYELWTHPYVSPLYGDLKNFPPTFMAAAGQDPLIDDNRAFARKLQEAGNSEVELLVHENMIHAYCYFLGLSKEEDETFKAIAGFLARFSG